MGYRGMYLFDIEKSAIKKSALSTTKPTRSRFKKRKKGKQPSTPLSLNSRIHSSMCCDIPPQSYHDSVKKKNNSNNRRRWGQGDNLARTKNKIKKRVHEERGGSSDNIAGHRCGVLSFPYLFFLPGCAFAQLLTSTCTRTGNCTDSVLCILLRRLLGTGLRNRAPVLGVTPPLLVVLVVWSSTTQVVGCITNYRV
jgi:hypothetical protein